MFKVKKLYLLLFFKLFLIQALCSYSNSLRIIATSLLCSLSKRDVAKAYNCALDGVNRFSQLTNKTIKPESTLKVDSIEKWEQAVLTGHHESIWTAFYYPNGDIKISHNYNIYRGNDNHYNHATFPPQELEYLDNCIGQYTPRYFPAPPENSKHYLTDLFSNPRVDPKLLDCLQPFPAHLEYSSEYGYCFPEKANPDESLPFWYYFLPL